MTSSTLFDFWWSSICAWKFSLSNWCSCVRLCFYLHLHNVCFPSIAFGLNLLFYWYLNFTGNLSEPGMQEFAMLQKLKEKFLPLFSSWGSEVCHVMLNVEKCIQIVIFLDMDETRRILSNIKSKKMLCFDDRVKRWWLLEWLWLKSVPYLIYSNAR